MTPDARRRVLELLERHGRDTTSFSILEAGFEHWFHDAEACVAYVDTGSAWVVAGGPIAAPEREAEVMSAFAAAARSAGRRPRFFGIEHELSADAGFDVIHLGEQPVWDPLGWQETLGAKRSLREQLRRARAKGVEVEVLAPADVERRRPEIERLIGRWLEQRSMAPMGFIVRVAPFELPEQRRFLVARQGERLLAMLVAVPIYARDGWLLDDVLRDPEAPNGTIELLFDAVLSLLAEEGSRHVTFGLAPLYRTRHRILSRVAGLSRPLYDFEGLARFKRKLEPQEWNPVYLAFPRGERGVVALLDSLRAFAGGSLWRFAWHTALHRAPLVAGVLAALLIPWTVLLALGPEWFPSQAVQSAWIAWDLALVAALSALCLDWRPRLARVLAIAGAADGAFGLLQLATFNAARIESLAELTVVVLAILLPGFAAVFLWCAADRSLPGSVS